MESEGAVAVQQVLESVQAHFNCKILTKSKVGDINFIRQAACVAIRLRYGVTTIGRCIDRNHSTICHYTKNHQMNMRIKLYADVYKYTRTLVQNIDVNISFLKKERDDLMERLQVINEMIEKHEKKDLQPELVSQ